MSQKIALALGSGSALGWAHIGVIRELKTMGIEPDIICASSIGSIVGAAYVAGNLDKLEAWVTSLSRLDVARFLELNIFSGGFVDVERLHTFFKKNVCDEELAIESLEIKFATVATNLNTGREIWFTEGSVLDAVWASMSVPGLFPPTQHHGQWLFDGGLVNPVPVSVCRALGADVVIAVNLNRDVLNKQEGPKPEKEEAVEKGVGGVLTSIKKYSASLFNSNDYPGTLDTLMAAINIMQDRITRSRMAGDPPDVLLSPRLTEIGPMEYHRAQQGIDEGRACVQRLSPAIKYALDNI